MTHDLDALETKSPRFRINYPQTIVYLCLVMVVAFALWLNGHNQHQDEVARCEAGVDTRNVQRQIVDAVYTLATSFIKQNPGDRPLTNAQIDQVNSYIQRVNEFRTDMYSKIKPSDICAPYVHDNPKPPTPDYPPLKKKPESS